MSDVIEHVARAIAAQIKGALAYVDDSNGLNCVCLDDDFDMLNTVRAVIAAMQDPSEEMLAQAPRHVWRAMIDGALK